MSLKLPMSTHGRGFPLLLLHGFAGSRSSWDALAPELAKFSTVVAVDLPGHASAPLPSNRGEEGFFEVVDALAACTEGPMDVLGYSQGARLALALALRHPKRVCRLVLESGTAGLSSEEWRLKRRAEDEANASLLEEGGVASFMDAWKKRPLFATQERLPLEKKQALEERRKAHSASGLAGALRCMGLGVQPNFWPLLCGLRVPTLLISGEEDIKFTSLAQQMACALPFAYHAAIPGSGHAVHLELPGEWQEVIKDFLEE